MNLLKHLRFFRAVAEARHFGNAAADLGMTQPPLSQGIRRLERHLGVRLFDRDARGVRITAAGHRILPSARDLLDAAEDLVATARGLALPEQVRLGITADLEDGIPGLLRALTTGGLSAAPAVAGSVELVDLLRDGLLDVGVVRHPSVLDGLTAGGVMVVPTRLVGGPTMSGSGLWDVRLPIAVPPRHHQPPAHDQFVDALRRAGHSGDVIEALDATQRQALVAVGAAAGVVPVAPDPGASATPSDSAPAPETPPLRLRVAMPQAAHRRPEVDHEVVAAAIGAVLVNAGAAG